MAGYVESCGEIKKERTEISQGTSNMEIGSDLDKRANLVGGERGGHTI